MPMIPSIATGPIGRPKGSTNLITNGGAETNATGWVGRNGTETIARSTTQAKFGAASTAVTLTAASGAEGVYHAFTGAALTQYTASLWAWAPVGVTIRIYGFDNISSFSSGTSIAGDSAWHLHTVTWTTGALAATFRVYARCETATQTGKIFYVDGAQVESGAVATPYIETDGGSASRIALKWVA